MAVEDVLNDSSFGDYESGPLQSRSAQVIAKRNVRFGGAFLRCSFVRWHTHGVMHLYLQEQLRRWTESETNKQNATLEHRQNVKFHVSAFDVCARHKRCSV